jgi:putative transcriptional regulator
MMIQLKIGERVDQQGLNIQQFADKAGIAYGTAYGLYKGRVNRLDLSTLDNVCRALNVEPGDILIRVPDDKQDE